MWLYICCKCGFRISAENVAECPECGASSWICHSTEENISQEIIAEKPAAPAKVKSIKSKQLSLL